MSKKKRTPPPPATMEDLVQAMGRWFVKSLKNDPDPVLQAKIDAYNAKLRRPKP